MEKYTLSADEKTLLKWNDFKTQFVDFQEDTKLQKVEIIAEMAFLNCRKIQKIRLPKGLTTIENAAFLHCTALEEINFPPSLKKCSFGAFLGCLALDWDTLPEWILKTPLKEVLNASDTALDKFIFTE